VLILLAAFTSLRWGEAIALRWPGAGQWIAEENGSSSAGRLPDEPSRSVETPGLWAGAWRPGPPQAGGRR